MEQKSGQDAAGPQRVVRSASSALLSPVEKIERDSSSEQRTSIGPSDAGVAPDQSRKSLGQLEGENEDYIDRVSRPDIKPQDSTDQRRRRRSTDARELSKDEEGEEAVVMRASSAKSKRRKSMAPGQDENPTEIDTEDLEGRRHRRRSARDREPIMIEVTVKEDGVSSTKSKHRRSVAIDVEEPKTRRKRSTQAREPIETQETDKEDVASRPSSAKSKHRKSVAANQKQDLTDIDPENVEAKVQRRRSTHAREAIEMQETDKDIANLPSSAKSKHRKSVAANQKKDLTDIDPENVEAKAQRRRSTHAREAIEMQETDKDVANLPSSAQSKHRKRVAADQQKDPMELDPENVEAKKYRRRNTNTREPTEIQETDKKGSASQPSSAKSKRQRTVGPDQQENRADIDPDNVVAKIHGQRSTDARETAKNIKTGQESGKMRNQWVEYEPVMLKERSDIEAIAELRGSQLSLTQEVSIFRESMLPSDFHPELGERRQSQSYLLPDSLKKKRRSKKGLDEVEDPMEAATLQAEHREQQKSIGGDRGQEAADDEKKERRKSKTMDSNQDGSSKRDKSRTDDLSMLSEVEIQRRRSTARSKIDSDIFTGASKSRRPPDTFEEIQSGERWDLRAGRVAGKTNQFVYATSSRERRAGYGNNSKDSANLDGFDFNNYGDRKNNKVFWMTNQISSDFKDDDSKIIANVSEFIMFSFFIVLLSIVAYNQDPAQKYHMERGIRRQLVDKSFRTYQVQDNSMKFYDIRENNHIWHYLNMSMLEGEWLDHFYGPDRVQARQEVEIKPFWHIMGVPQLRQLRVHDQSCEIHPIFENMFKKCYGYFSEDAEQIDAISPVKRAFYFDSDLTKKYNQMHWTWMTGQLTHHVDFSTPLGTYSGGGYLVNLTRQENAEWENQRMFSYLHEFVWLNRETRVLFVDFTIYNPNVKLMSAVKLIFEIPPTGGVYPSWDIKTVQMFHLVTRHDYFVFGVFCSVVAFGGFLLVEEIREIAYFKGRYFLQLWTYVDIAIVALVFLALICLIRVLSQIKIAMEHYLRSLNEFFCMEDLIFTETLYDRVLIALFFLAFLRLLRYMGFFGTIHQYYETASKCKWDLFYFGVSYFMVFFAFAQIGFFFFGRFNEDFQSIERSMFTLIRMFFGYVHYQNLVHSNRVLGPIYFLAFSIIVYYLMMSMFLIILYQNYVEQEAEILVRKGPTAGSIMISFCRRILMSIFSDPPPPMPVDYITVAEIEDALALLNFTEPEIDVFKRKYAIDEKKTVEPQDVSKILREIERLGLEQLSAKRNEQNLLSEVPVKKPKYPALLLDEYHALLAKIDQIEVQVETMSERIVGILNVLVKTKQVMEVGKDPSEPT